MWLEEMERLLAASPVRRLVVVRGPKHAAMLVPLYVAFGELWVLLTQRVGGRARYVGRFGFPGGMCREGDADEVATALREAKEEIGLDPSVVVVLGRLDDVWASNGCVISPVVGAVPYPLAVQPASEEVEAVVRLPFSYLANPEAVEEHEVKIAGRTVASPVYHYRSHRLGGPTAHVVADLVGRLTGGAVPLGR